MKAIFLPTHRQGVATEGKVTERWAPDEARSQGYHGCWVWPELSLPHAPGKFLPVFQHRWLFLFCSPHQSWLFPTPNPGASPVTSLAVPLPCLPSLTPLIIRPIFCFLLLPKGCF